MILEEKISLSLRRLEDIYLKFAGQSIAVAWTGGKDSTVALYLWQQILREKGETSPLVLNLDTGVKFPQVLKFRDELALQWELDLHIARPQVKLDDYPVAQDCLKCCQELKIAPLCQAVKDLQLTALISGVRGDENPERAKLGWQEDRYEPDYLMIHPLLHWTEMDIWSFIIQQGLPYCELYDQGYRSLGCKPCTFLAEGGGDERSGRSQAKEQQMEQLRSLGYF